MVTGRCQVDRTTLDRHAIFGIDHAQRAAAIECVGKIRILLADMEDDEHRGWQVGWEVGEYTLQRRDGPG